MKSFPKEFAEETTMNPDGFPTYHRPNVDFEEWPEDVQKKLTKWTTDGFGEKLKLTVDNRFIVPYNPHLSRLFNCHLNVEYCGTVGAVKYLYK